jgi:hypothetical protein
LSGEQITTCSTHAGRVAEASGRGRERVVRLELHHAPGHDPERLGRLLGRVELREEVGLDPVAGLVASVELVAERLDHVVVGARDVRHVGLAHERDEGREQRAKRPDRLSLGVVSRRRAVEGAEELVRAVDEVDLHIRARRTR